ncbi:CPBP family intramembrane glutamic endopeptidase [Leptobacterium sp. I13]|uniref:CPBP family intramembrane glutamic endopeptidase n=1 Tax=Leptobacterium meishanense TaxID=3128904 RepID=UPI0030EBD945
MYIEQAFKSKNEWWRYITGIVIVFIGVTLFSVPHAIAIAMKSMRGDLDPSRMQDTEYLLQAFEPNLNLVLLLLPFAGGFLTLFFVVKYIHKQQITALTTSRKKIDWKRVVFAFTLIAIISITLISIDFIVNPNDYQWNFKLVPFLVLVIIGALLIPLQTSFEEYLFRGYLMQGIGILARNRWIPLVITSLVFGLLHLQNPEIDKLGKIAIVYYIATGFFLGIMTLMDDGLELAIGYHAANNLITALLVTADWTAFQTHSLYKDVSDPELGFDMFIPILVIYPLLLFVFYKKYNWSNWRERLTGSVERFSREEALVNE